MVYLHTHTPSTYCCQSSARLIPFSMVDVQDEANNSPYTVCSVSVCEVHYLCVIYTIIILS